jgi:HPt (histidine-containing phosphotransfer) domain-containing protein
VLQEIIGLFRQDCPKLMAAMTAGLANGDCGVVYHAAHTLKGTVGNFDAFNAMNMAERLEGRALEGDLPGCRQLYPHLKTDIDALLVTVTAAADSLRCAS